MRRRSFFGISAGSLVPFIWSAGCKTETHEPDRELSVLDSNGKIGGKTLEEIRAQYYYDLFDDYLPFHDKFVVDHKYGGFTVNTDWDGPGEDFNKNSLMLGRGLWTYSYLYNNLEKNPKHLETAQKVAEFLLKHKPEGNRFWPYQYSKEGNIIVDQTDNIGIDTYIAYGFCEYSRATGDEYYWNLAKERVYKVLEVTNRPGYNSSQLFPKGMITQGHWFTLLFFASQMLESKPDSEIETLASQCVNAILKHHYNPDYDLICESLSQDLTLPDNDKAQLVLFSHCFQTLWIIMHEALRRKDRTLFDRSAELLKRHLEVAWDDVYGGLFGRLDHIDRNEWELRKTGWVHCEAITGLLCVIEYTGANWAKDFFSRLNTYTQNTFPLKKYGLPLWMDTGDRKGKFVKSDKGRVAENFHYPRHFMFNYLALNRMIARGGAVPRTFHS